MRILLVNPAYDAGLEPQELLDRYDTTTGWGEALLAAGADEVVTLQRYSRDLDLVRAGVTYRLRADGPGARPTIWTWPRGLLAAARAFRADVVHANGLVFPTQILGLRRALPRSTPVVVQHHAGGPPIAGGVKAALRRFVWRHSLAGVDAFLFTALDQAAPWRAAGLIRSDQRVLAIPESSRVVRPVARDEARRRSGLSGEPAVLWVGRLRSQKDPLAVLDGFARFSESMPNARLTFVHQTDELLPALRARLAADPRLGACVRLVGAVPHAALPDFLCAADIFALGSHDEGSGYALIEALACGLVPVVTDIPSFRALTDGGRLGRLWPPGDAEAMAAGLRAVSDQPLAPQREAVLRHFEAEQAWPAVGRRALALYREILGAAR